MYTLLTKNPSLCTAAACLLPVPTLSPDHDQSGCNHSHNEARREGDAHNDSYGLVVVLCIRLHPICTVQGYNIRTYTPTGPSNCHIS